MPSYSVLDHRLEGEHYRLTIGLMQEVQAPVLDDQGNPTYDDSDSTTTPVPKLETKLIAISSEDFLFAADDERWEGKGEVAIAAEQRQDVLDQLAKRETDRQEAERKRQEAPQLPGIGEALA